MAYDTSQIIAKEVEAAVRGVCRKAASKAYRAANELKNASAHVLKGQRSGRVYKIPRTYGKKPSKATSALKKQYTGKDGKVRKLRGGQLYRASAPGEPPAVRLGTFRLSWKPRVGNKAENGGVRIVSSIESTVRAGEYLLGDMLEDGNERMEPRPYKQAVKDMAMPKIKAIYDELGH